MDWIDLAHDRDQWRALVNTVMKLLLSGYDPPRNRKKSRGGLFHPRNKLQNAGITHSAKIL
jgi:hypothetical protein